MFGLCCFCQSLIKKAYLDPREHQSWTDPRGTLLNLYQRQCLTLDRDAPPGVQEVWTSPLGDGKGSVAVLFVNKGKKESRITVTWEMLQWKDSVVARARDLWAHSDLKLPLSSSLTQLVKSHDVVMLVLTPSA